MSLYFISFIVVGNIFILNLFVGIVIDKFNRLKDSMNGYGLMTFDQKECIESEKQMTRLSLMMKKSAPTDSNKKLAFEIINKKHFEHFITFSIICSTIVMSLKYYTMNDTFSMNL
jgi:hypothetical protein